MGLCCEVAGMSVTNPNVVRGGSPTVGRELLDWLITGFGFASPTLPKPECFEVAVASCF